MGGLTRGGMGWGRKLEKLDVNCLLQPSFHMQHAIKLHFSLRLALLCLSC